MKIKEITTHIAVEWGPRRVSNRHFSVDNVKKFQNLSIELVKDIGVRVYNDEDNIVIPFVNVTHMKIEQEPLLSAPSQAEADVLGLNEPDVDELEYQEAYSSKTKSRSKK